MSEEVKAVSETPVAPVADSVPAVTETSAVEEVKPIEETPLTADTTADAIAAEATEEVKPVEPKESGHLHYNAPSNFLKEFLPIPPKKVFFWFGEEPVESTNLKAYLAKGKEAATSTAAWASQTGKGLLFFNKHGEDKSAPSGALNLADSEDIKSSGTSEFAFKLHGHKHKFDAQTPTERDSWVTSIKKIAEEAKAKKEEIVSSEGYKSALASFKPAPVAAVTAPKVSEETPKKSTDALAEEETPAEVAEEKKTAKSRSRSRGAPILGFFKGKKSEAPKEETPATTEPTEAAVEPVEETEPVIEAVPAAEEAKKEEAIEEAATPTTEAKKDRRVSRFESFLRGKPTKKEEAIPSTEEPISAEPPKIEEPAAEPALESLTAPIIAADIPAIEEPKEEEKKEEVAPATARKSSFVAGLKGFAQKVRSPSSEHPPAVAETAAAVEEPTAETAAAEVPATEAPIVEDAPATNGETKAEKRRSSFFNLATFNKKKAEATAPAAEEPVTTEAAEDVAEPTVATEEPVAAETEAPKAEETTETPTKGHKDSPIASLGRRFSKAIRGDKAKKTSAKVEETEPIAETKDVEETPAATEAEPIKSEEPTSIGDVVPEAVSVGTAPPASQTVSATA